MEPTSYCSDCRKEKKFKLYLDVTNKLDRYVQVLASCTTCHKGKWIEFDHDQFEKIKV